MSRTGGIRRWATSLAIAPLMMLATPISSRAQFTTLVSFTGANGNQPFMENLVQGKNGSLYGTTTYGGTSGNGTIFKVTPTGTLTTIYNFANTPDGANPDAGLVLGTDGKFYGTAYQGGTSGLGTGLQGRDPAPRADRRWGPAGKGVQFPLPRRARFRHQPPARDRAQYRGPARS